MNMRPLTPGEPEELGSSLVSGPVSIGTRWSKETASAAMSLGTLGVEFPSGYGIFNRGVCKIATYLPYIVAFDRTV
jgi:hypothetical protein